MTVSDTRVSHPCPLFGTSHSTSQLPTQSSHHTSINLPKAHRCTSLPVRHPPLQAHVNSTRYTIARHTGTISPTFPERSPPKNSNHIQRLLQLLVSSQPTFVKEPIMPRLKNAPLNKTLAKEFTSFGRCCSPPGPVCELHKARSGTTQRQHFLYADNRPGVARIKSVASNGRSSSFSSVSFHTLVKSSTLPHHDNPIRSTMSRIVYGYCTPFNTKSSSDRHLRASIMSYLHSIAGTSSLH